MIERLRKNLSYLNAFLFSYSGSQPEPTKTLVCNSDQIRFYANTPNTIIYYDVDGQRGFFRECKKHSIPRLFVWQLIEEYCKYVYQNENSVECETILKEKLSSEKNLNKFFNMGAGTANYSHINKFRNSLDSSLIGIDKPYPEWFEKQLLDLVQYAWGALDEYKYCLRYAVGQYHMFNANRTITTKRIVDLLGEPNLVPESNFIRLILDGEDRMGVSVGVATGCSPENVSSNRLSPEFQRQSLVLNVADVICYQKDHRPGNYFISVENGSVMGLCAFDNDCPTTLFNTPNVAFTTYIGCSALVDKYGYINRPYLDKNSTLLLMKITKQQLFSAIGNSCSQTEKNMLWIRIEKLKGAIDKSICDRRVTLLEKSEWTIDTIKEELTGKYGMTYAKKFYEVYIKS